MKKLMSASPLGIAARRVALMPRETVKGLIADLERRLARMRTCRSSVYDVDELRFAAQVSQIVEQQGVIRGFAADIDKALLVLGVMAQRFQEHTSAGLRGSPALRGEEITALHDVIGLHRFQLMHLSAGEFGRCFRKAACRHRPELLDKMKSPASARNRTTTGDEFVTAFRRRQSRPRNITQMLKRVNTHFFCPKP